MTNIKNVIPDEKAAMSAISTVAVDKTNALRKSGLEMIGEVPWGTHFCQFYETASDLFDVLVPYFKTGLENNEFCMWITSETLSREEAENAMRKAVPDFDKFLKGGQMEIVPYSEWYLKDGTFGLRRVLDAWISKLDEALAKGYDGIRVTGNTAWLEKKNWKDFVAYEEKVNSIIGKYRMIVVCTYSISKSGAADVIDVIRNHQFALIRREGKWELIESSETKQAKEALRESEEKYRRIYEGASDAMVYLDTSGKIFDANKKAVELFGGSKEELLGEHFAKLGVFSVKKLPTLMSAFAKILTGKQAAANVRIKNRKGREIYLECSASLIKTHDRHAILLVARDITERKKAEEALRKSESESRTLLENLPQKIFFKDKNSVYISCNENYARDLKIHRDEITGKTDYDFYPKELAEKYRADDKRIMTSGKAENIEEEYIQDGRKAFVHTVKTPVKDENGNVVGVLGIFWDISERKKAEEELRESEEKYRGLFENARDVIFMGDMKGNISDVNRFVEEYDLKRDEVVGKNILKFVSKKHWLGLLLQLAKLSQGKLVEGEIEIITPKGKIISEYRSSPIRREEKVVGFQTILRNITERKKMEDSLRESEEKYRNLVESTKDSIVIIDLTGNVLFGNKATEELTGYTPKNGVRMNVRQVTPLKYWPKSLAMLLRAKQGKSIPYFESMIKRKDGMLIPVESGGQVIFKNGKVVGVQIITRDITERKKMEEALKRQRDIAIALSGAKNFLDALNRLFDNLLEIEEFDCAGFYLFDKETRTLDMIAYRGLPDKFVEKVSHFDADSPYTKVVLEGKSLYQKASDFPPPIRKDIQSSGIRSVAAIPIHYEGETIGHLNIASYSHDEISALNRHVLESVSAQIGETIVRVRMEEKLRESEEKFRNMVELAPDLIVTVNAEGVIVSCNSAAEFGSGYSEEEIIGKHFLESPLMHGIDAVYAQKLFNSIMKEEPLEPIEVSWLRKDGASRTSEVRISLMKTDGKAIGFTAIARDITERKEMAEKLKHYSEHLEEIVQKRTEELLESEKRYSVLVEEASDGVLIAQDEKIAFINKRAAETLGYSRDELIGMPLETPVEEKYRQLVIERYTRRLRGEKVPTTYEVEVVAKTGEHKPIELSATRINYQGRSADLIIIRDISERKEVEEQRLRLEKLATMGELATMVAHDLRNPLTSIRNACFYIKNTCPTYEANAKFETEVEMLDIIERETLAASSIINDLLDFAARRPLQKKRQNINNQIDGSLKHIHIPQNISVEKKYAKKAAAAVDEKQLERVFLNLTKNAVQAMPNGGTLTITTKETKDHIEIAFSDTGIGIQEENMNKLFTPLYTTKAKGIGVGLAICKRIVEQHDGTIEAQSKAGKGTTFTIKLLKKEETNAQ